MVDGLDTSALSHVQIEQLETQLKMEVDLLLAPAEQTDQSALPDGMNLPVKIARHQARLAAMAAPKVKERGKKPGGKPPKPPTTGPKPQDQLNLSDEESRTMPVAGGGFEQAYSAQAAVDTASPAGCCTRRDPSPQRQGTGSADA